MRRRYRLPSRILTLMSYWRQTQIVTSRVRRPALAVAIALLAVSGISCSHEPGPSAGGAKVVLISLDGLRADAVTLENSPTLVRLAKEGASTLQARTVEVTLTLPSHTSMLTGVPPSRHGITWNDDTTGHGLDRVTVPTVFDVARQAGFTSAMYVGKSKLSAILHSGAPTYVKIPSPAEISWKTDTVAARLIEDLSTTSASLRPDMTFIHFPDIDVAGHASGWMSPDYISKVKHTDSVVAVVWAALRRAYGTDLVLIITADHGGVDKAHGDGGVLSRTTPWIAWGRFVAPQTALPVGVRNIDVGPTMLWVLGITPPADWDGVPVRAAFPSLNKPR
jgi:arylsulfatase A-like enzyme